ncbi:hypothetical protein [Leuconostoc citreum]|uniref:hypothetical protein n=1 Tax=Leuconostoc citreum TaxID=33964 RepID=UPI0032DF9475
MTVKTKFVNNHHNELLERAKYSAEQGAYLSSYSAIKTLCSELFDQQNSAFSHWYRDCEYTLRATTFYVLYQETWKKKHREAPNEVLLCKVLSFLNELEVSIKASQGFGPYIDVRMWVEEVSEYQEFASISKDFISLLTENKNTKLNLIKYANEIILTGLNRDPLAWFEENEL